MMLSFRLLFLTLLLSAATARAQTQPATAVPVRAAYPASVSLTRADTARAIRRLFRNRRGGGSTWLAFGTAGVLASTLPALQTTSAGVWTPGVVAGSAAMLIGLNKRLQFRAGRERQVLRGLAATGRLPAGVTRRLRGKFAPQHGTPSDYNPLLAKDIYVPNPATPLTADQLRETARADTLRAIDRMFERRRKGGKRWVYVGVGGVLALVRSRISPPSNGNSLDGGGTAVLAGAFIGVPVAIGILNLSAYSEAHEEEVDRRYRAGQPLPKKIRQRIKRKDLEPLD